MAFLPSLLGAEVWQDPPPFTDSPPPPISGYESAWEEEGQRALPKLGDLVHPWVFPYLGDKVHSQVLGGFSSGNLLHLYFPSKLR